MKNLALGLLLLWIGVFGMSFTSFKLFSLLEDRHPSHKQWKGTFLADGTHVYFDNGEACTNRDAEGKLMIRLDGIVYHYAGDFEAKLNK